MTLAIKGGEPIRYNHLAYGKQQIDEKDIQQVVNVLRGDYLTTGPTVQAFEDKVAQYVGAKYAVAVSNGTAALHVALLGCGIGEGDEVIVTPMTFAASSNAILYVGAKPVFVDIDKETYNINIDAIEEKITTRTKAIVAVDFAGHPVDADKLNALAAKYGLQVIEDGAHSLGSMYKGKKVGPFVTATTFSFHPVKPITTGEGGMIVTNDEVLYKKMIMYRSHGITRDSEILEDKEQGNWYYEQQLLGYNYRMTDIQAALGMSQMDKVEQFIARRREIVETYNDALGEVEEVILPTEVEGCQSGSHIYVIRIKSDKIGVKRKEIYEALQAEGIGVNVHYIPVYLHPYYQKLGYEKGLCPVSEEVYETMLTLPLFPAMNNQDVEDVIKAVTKVFRYYSN